MYMWSVQLVFFPFSHSDNIVDFFLFLADSDAPNVFLAAEMNFAFFEVEIFALF